MENQHRKITGYRELEQKEIDLMNKIKALGPQLEDVLEEVRLHLLNQRQSHTPVSFVEGTPSPALTDYQLSVLQRLADATPERFLALAKTDFQTALMYATRAVAQPTFF